MPETKIISLHRNKQQVGGPYFFLENLWKINGNEKARVLKLILEHAKKKKKNLQNYMYDIWEAIPNNLLNKKQLGNFTWGFCSLFSKFITIDLI